MLQMHSDVDLCITQIGKIYGDMNFYDRKIFRIEGVNMG